MIEEPKGSQAHTSRPASIPPDALSEAEEESDLKQEQAHRQIKKRKAEYQKALRKAEEGVRWTVETEEGRLLEEAREKVHVSGPEWKRKFEVKEKVIEDEGIVRSGAKHVKIAAEITRETIRRQSLPEVQRKEAQTKPDMEQAEAEVKCTTRQLKEAQRLLEVRKHQVYRWNSLRERTRPFRQQGLGSGRAKSSGGLT